MVVESGGCTVTEWWLYYGGGDARWQRVVVALVRGGGAGC